MHEFSVSQDNDALGNTSADPTGLALPTSVNPNNALDTAIANLIKTVNGKWPKVNFTLLQLDISTVYTNQVLNCSGTNFLIAAANVSLPTNWYISIAPDNQNNGPIPRGLGNQVTGVSFSRLYYNVNSANVIPNGTVYLLVWADTPATRVELR